MKFYGTTGRRTQKTTGGNPQGARDALRRGPGSRQEGPGIATLIFIPWLCFTAVLLALGLFQGSWADYLWLPAVVAAVFAGVYAVRAAAKSRMAGEVFLGVMCLTACLTGVTVGQFVRSEYLRESYRLGQGARYLNVLPDEAGAGHTDATMLSFANGTLVDSQRSFGYADGLHAGTVYCAAPIRSTSTVASGRVEYWAVGTDCCGQRGAFACDDAGSADATGGVVLPKGNKDEVGFRMAVDAASKQYQLVSSDGYLLVRWVTDPDKYRNALWKVGMAWIFSSIGVYLLVACTLGCTVHRLL